MSLELLQKVGDVTVCPTAALVKEGKILLGYRNYVSNKQERTSAWITPGGRCDEGETVEQCLRREIKEEVGIDEFEIKELIGVIPGVTNGDIVPVFYCTTNQDAKLMEPDKFSKWKWVSFEDYINGEPWKGVNSPAYNVITQLIIQYLKSK